MNITRSRGFKVNLGNYEHVEFFASITVGTDDFPTSSTDQLAAFADEALEKMLRPDLDNAAALTVKEESFLYQEHEPEPAPRLERTTRTPRRRN